jgi:hypothetical protein
VHRVDAEMKLITRRWRGGGSTKASSIAKGKENTIGTEILKKETIASSTTNFRIPGPRLRGGHGSRNATAKEKRTHAGFNGQARVDSELEIVK